MKVRLHSGEDQWILVHLEIQTSYEEQFATRLGLYNAGLYWTFRQRVVTLVILADLRRNWLPQEDVFQVAEFESRMRFPICKLIQRLESDWQDDDSFPVQIARAQIEALKTASDPEGRYNAKWQLVRNLYEMGYNADDLRELFRIIDWMMHLRPDLDERFEQQINEYEEQFRMPYVTSIERIGQLRGTSKVITTVLARQIGELPQGVQDHISKLSLDDLETLTNDMFELTELDQLEAWLGAHPPAANGETASSGNGESASSE